LDGRCASKSQDCDGSIKDSTGDIKPTTITYTGANRNSELVIPLKQSSQTIGSIHIPAKAFPNNWTLSILPSDVDHKLDNSCQQKQERVSPVFDIVVRDSRGRERGVSGLSRPILLSIFTQRISSLSVAKQERFCFAFAGRFDPKFQCLENTNFTETKNPEVYLVESATDHLTSFAVLFSNPRDDCGDHEWWIVSISLVSSALTLVLAVGILYYRSKRFRALVMGYEPSRSLSQTLTKVEKKSHVHLRN